MMSPDFDIEDWHSWPADLAILNSEVRLALEDGELRPLANYLRAGHPVDGQLRRSIADLIEGRGLRFELRKKAKKRGQRLLSDDQTLHDLRMSIGIEFELRRRAGPNEKYESIVTDMVDESKCGGTEPMFRRTFVTEAHAYVCKQLKYGWEFDGFIYDWPLLLKAFPDEFTVTPEGTVYERSKDL